MAVIPAVQEPEEGGSLELRSWRQVWASETLTQKLLITAKCWSLTPLILATWEAEIRRPAHAVSETLSQKKYPT
jgi:hypothetical protein